MQQDTQALDRGCNGVHVVRRLPSPPSHLFVALLDEVVSEARDLFDSAGGNEARRGCLVRPPDVLLQLREGSRGKRRTRFA